MSDPVKVAARIRVARKVAGVTQEDAARELGVSARTYARWEAADSFGFLKEIPRIAELFGTTPSALMGEASALEHRVEQLGGEVRQLRRVLLDPRRLRAMADAIEGSP